MSKENWKTNIVGIIYDLHNLHSDFLSEHSYLITFMWVWLFFPEDPGNVVILNDSGSSPQRWAPFFDC